MVFRNFGLTYSKGCLLLVVYNNLLNRLKNNNMLGFVLFVSTFNRLLSYNPIISYSIVYRNYFVSLTARYSNTVIEQRIKLRLPTSLKLRDDIKRVECRIGCYLRAYSKLLVCYDFSMTNYVITNLLSSSRGNVRKHECDRIPTHSIISQQSTSTCIFYCMSILGIVVCYIEITYYSVY